MDGKTSGTKRRRPAADRNISLHQLLSAESSIGDDDGGTLLRERLEQVDDLRPYLMLDRWMNTSEIGQDLLVEVMSERLPMNVTFFGWLPRKDADDDNGRTLRLPVFRHDPSGVHLNLIPGGDHVMGVNDELWERLRELLVERIAQNDDEEDEEEVRTMTDEELAERQDGWFLSEMKSANPDQIIRLQPFLLADGPLTLDQSRSWIQSIDDEHNQSDDRAGDHGILLSAKHVKFILDPPECLRLPSEAEWEYAARAGMNICSPFGDRLPEESDLVYRYNNERKNFRNRFGLVGLGSFPELCADAWSDSYSGIALDGSPRPSVVFGYEFNPTQLEGGVYRGGAIGGWQDCGEWAMMLPFLRHKTPPSRVEASICLRLALDIPASQKKPRTVRPSLRDLARGK